MLVLGSIRQRQFKSLAEVEAPVGDVLAADAEDAAETNPVPLMGRVNELNAALLGNVDQSFWDYAPAGIREDESLRGIPSEELTAEQARQKVAEAGIEGQLDIPERGLPSLALDILIRRKKEELQRQSVQARAPTGAGMALLRLGVGLGVSLTDPINVGLGFFPVVAGAKYAAWLAGKGAVGRAGVRAGVGALEGAAGALAVEPLILGATALEQRDYGLMDSFLNVVFGTAIGGGLHSIGGAVGDFRAARANPITSLPTEAKQTVLASAVGARVEGAPVKAAETLDALAKESPTVARVVERARIRAWHGSPHTFDRFDLAKIGAGEGKQAFGHGLYFAESRAVAEYYRDALSTFENAEQAAALYLSGANGDAAKAIEMMTDHAVRGGLGHSAAESKLLREGLQLLKNGERPKAPPGALYEVEIRANQDELIDLDEPLFKQSDLVRNAFARVGIEHDGYGYISPPTAEQVAALKAEGVKGVRYLDGPSRGDGTGNRNYVTFDDSIVRMVSRNGEAVAPRASEEMAPEWVQSSREADEIAAKAPANPEARMQAAQDELALAEEELQALLDAGAIDEADARMMKAADEAVALARSYGKAAAEGAACMSRNGAGGG